MGLKLGLVAGIVTLVAAFGVLSLGATASAQERTAAGQADELSVSAGLQAPRWLRHSIIVCAARVMDLEVSQVQAGLRQGHSLKEIGIRAGVRPVQLENGILRCERALLERLVNAGRLEPAEARRIFNFLETHITRIINLTWNEHDQALTAVAPAERG